MDTNLDRILLESKLRIANQRAAILFGFFGNTQTEIVKNLEISEKEAEKAVKDLETALSPSNQR